SGGTAEPMTLVTSNGYTWGVAVDATDVYWTDTDGDVVMKVPKGGGLPVKLATGSQPTSIAVDATDVYWTNTYSGEVMRVPKGGGVPVVFAAGQPRAGSVVLAAAFVSWTTHGTGLATESTVTRAPKIGGPPVVIAMGYTSPDTIGKVALDAADVYWS